ncbi:MAG TPA: YetF domain-containing protein [Blastocatellia bacterium]|nr:YetF domain-containing protein [Blastocatellia bacterium]
MDAKLWTDLLHPDISIVEKIIRPILVYLFLIAGLRLAGKRELAQLNPFDLVVLLTLSNTVQNAIIGNDNSVLGGLIGATTLLLVNYVVVRFFYTHTRLDRMIEGDADVLIENGQINEARCKKELITRAELEAAARRQGFTSLADIERAVLEPGGTLTFIGKRPTAEATRHDELLAKLDAVLRELAELKKATR